MRTVEHEETDGGGCCLFMLLLILFLFVGITANPRVFGAFVDGIFNTNIVERLDNTPSSN